MSVMYLNKDGLYILKLDSLQVEQIHAAVDMPEIWHRRLGHIGNEGLRQLGLPILEKKCSTCIEGKAKRLLFQQQIKRTQQIGELIHSDLSGPINPPTENGEKYFQVILDDFSHFVVVKLLKAKDEAEQNLIEYISEIERQHELPVKRLRLDNGGEFSSNNFKRFARQKGIKLEYTMSYSPQMGGKAERMNQTLLNMVRTKLIDSGIAKHLWGEAIRCSAYELNRSPTTTLNKGKTPAFMWHGKNDISKLRIFGCRVWYNVIPKENKLNPRAKRAVMLGYCGGGYRLWSPEELKIIQSRDVKFDEEIMECKSQNSQIFEDDGEEDKEDQKEQSKEVIVRERKDEIDEDENEGKIQEQYQPRPKRTSQQPSHLNDYELYTAYCMLTSVGEPETFEEANKLPEWKQAIKKELESHETLQTWTPAKLPENKAAIDTRWIFKVKTDGTKKARLVAKGFQMPFEEGEFSYAPVCRMSTIRILLSMAAQENWPLKQIDVPTAFLNGLLDTDVYINKPEGVKCNEEILKLNRALYGLRRAPKCWNDHFNNVMEKLNFQRSKYDFCLYKRKGIFLVLFVDDALITGHADKIEETISDLHKEFKVKSDSNVSTFLGMKINQSKNRIQVSQPGIIERLLQEFNMEQCRGVSTPMETNFHYEEDAIDNNVPYRRLVCSLMYLSVTTRPDLSYSVSYLSRYLDKPTDKLWKAAKRILRYVNQTKDLGITFKKGSGGLVSYSDADWASDKDSRKSVSGLIVFYNGNPIS